MSRMLMVLFLEEAERAAEDRARLKRRMQRRRQMYKYLNSKKTVKKADEDKAVEKVKDLQPTEDETIPKEDPAPSRLDEEQGAKRPTERNLNPLQG